MSLKDFAYKHKESAKEHGLPYAAYHARWEAVNRIAMPAARALQRPIWAADADVVLVLDACRHDLWCDVAGSEPWSSTDSAWSVGSASPEWINETFADAYRELWSRAGYVTANPFSGKRPERMPILDSSVYPLEDRGLGYLDEVWRDQWPMDDLATVDPGTLTDRAFYAYDRMDQFGLDTLVVHYMQPHMPFRSHPEWHDGWGGQGTFGEPDNNPASKDTWLKVRDGELSRDTVWAAYEDNLRWVLAEVQRWYEATGARVLVTSDHGNATGEWGQWSHPPNSANPVLRKVPWVGFDGANTRSPEYDVEIDSGQDSSATVDDRLSALGYK